jgi:hypothetical protein
MKKILIIFVFFIAFNVYANANWQHVGEAITGEIYFIDRNSLQKSGDSITFWQLNNYANRDKFGHLSSKSQRTINCRTREVINRYFMFYDDINSKGKLTYSFEATDKWMPIAPETGNWSIYLSVCK